MPGRVGRGRPCGATTPQDIPLLQSRGGACQASNSLSSWLGTVIALELPDMGRTILVVDDETELVASCERLLRRAGHESLRAYTGPEAMALIDSDQPDLVVADLRLPKADGLAVARHARAQVPPIPVILITAYDSWQARQSASEAGVEAYLAKPFSNAEFLQAVLRVLPPKAIDELGSGHP